MTDTTYCKNNDLIVEIPGGKVTSHELARILLNLPDRQVQAYINDFELHSITHVSCDSPGGCVELDLRRGNVAI